MASLVICKAPFAGHSKKLSHGVDTPLGARLAPAHVQDAGHVHPTSSPCRRPVCAPKHRGFPNSYNLSHLHIDRNVGLSCDLQALCCGGARAFALQFRRPLFGVSLILRCAGKLLLWSMEQDVWPELNALTVRT